MGFAAFPVNSSSRTAVHRPSFRRGWTFRSYSKEVAPERSTFRTVFRDTLRARTISLIVLPLRKCSRRIRPIVSTVSIPPTARFESKRAAHQPNLQGSKLHAEQQKRRANRKTKPFLVAGSP